MVMPGMNGGEYFRYGFGSMEMDDEIKGVKGSSYDYGARMLDVRVGRWLSIDPKTAKQASQSPYKAMLNNPIYWVDPKGETEWQVIRVVNQKGEVLARTSYKVSGKVMSHGYQSARNPLFGYKYSYSTFTDFKNVATVVVNSNYEVVKVTTERMHIMYSDNQVWRYHEESAPFGTVIDYDFEQSGGFYMTGKDGQGTRYTSKNAEYVGSMDAFFAIATLATLNYKKNVKTELAKSVIKDMAVLELMKTLFGEDGLLADEVPKNINDQMDALVTQAKNSSKKNNLKDPVIVKEQQITIINGKNDTIPIYSKQSRKEADKIIGGESNAKGDTITAPPKY